MADHTTTVTIRGKATGKQEVTGFSKALDALTLGLTKTTKETKASQAEVKKYQKEITALQDSLKDTAKEQLAVIEAMQGMDKAAPAYAEATKKAEELEEKQRRLEKQIKLTNVAYAEQAKEARKSEQAREQRHGSFTQGYLQGAIPGGALIQRGPGAVRQAAGAYLGTSTRTMVGGAASSLFTGASGLASGLSGIPFIGPAMAAMMQNAMGLAGGALQQQTMEASLAPFLGSGNFLERRSAEGGGVLARRGGWSAHLRRADEALMEGTRFGMDRSEMAQLAAQMSQVAGGRALEESAGQSMIPVAAAAQRAYGLGADVSGAFLLGDRRGASRNGAGGEGLVQAIGKGFELGLRGSELSEYVQNLAGDIASWKSTGIALDVESVQAMTGIAARAGLGGVQGTRVTMGLRDAGRQMALGGIQSPEQLMMLKHFYGFRGGSLKDLNDATLRAEEGTMDSAGFGSFLQEINERAGGDPELAKRVARNVFGQLGVQVGQRHIDLMLKVARGDKLEGEDAQRMASFEGELKGAMGGPKTRADLFATAEATTTGAMRRQAGLTNQNLVTGGQMIPAMQNLEQQSATLARTFQVGLGGAVTNVTGKLASFSKELENLVVSLKKHGLLGTVTHSL